MLEIKKLPNGNFELTETIEEGVVDEEDYHKDITLQVFTEAGLQVHLDARESLAIALKNVEAARESQWTAAKVTFDGLK